MLLDPKLLQLCDLGIKSGSKRQSVSSLYKTVDIVPIKVILFGYTNTMKYNCVIIYFYFGCSRFTTLAEFQGKHYVY